MRFCLFFMKLFEVSHFTDIFGTVYPRVDGYVSSCVSVPSSPLGLMGLAEPISYVLAPTAESPAITPYSMTRITFCICACRSYS